MNETTVLSRSPLLDNFHLVDHATFPKVIDEHLSAGLKPPWLPPQLSLNLAIGSLVIIALPIYAGWHFSNGISLMLRPHCFQPSILRENDIRGIVGETLNTADATALGHAFVALTRNQLQRQQPRIAIARDGRLSSPELEAHLCASIEAAGGIAVCLGCAPTPMLYFAVHTLDVDAGIVVTGSHNPKTHNGFKMLIGRNSLSNAEIKHLADLAAAPQTAPAIGGRITADIAENYVDRLLAGLDGADIGGLSIGWDTGNGATGEILKRLTAKLPGRHLLINDVIDGHFPAHHPDPTQAANLVQLQELVASNGLDLGIAFDGDGDRLGVVDAMGRIVWSDQLLTIFSRDVLQTHPGAVIIADVKASQVFFEEVTRLGGKPLMWKTGHSLIKNKMIEMQAKLAGEMSGHIFFADNYFGFDDALYAAIRLLRVIGRTGISLARMYDQLPEMVNTPEIRIDCDDAEKFLVVARVAAVLMQEGAKVDATDGVRVYRPEGWWLLRASNTQAMLVIRAEAREQSQLDRLLIDLRHYLAAQAISFDLNAPSGLVDNISERVSR